MKSHTVRRRKNRRATLNTKAHTMAQITEITLPSGAVATIELGKGLHVRKAQKMSEGDTSLYMNCMMSLLVTVDGQRFVPEAFDDMPANDYVELLSKMTEINFTSAQNK